MRTTLALFCCSWSYGLLRLDRGVAQTIAALNQLFQPSREACCRCAIDNAVIKAQSHTEVFPQSDLPVNDTRLLGDVDLADPEPNRVDVFLYYDHPPIPDRLQFALTYDPWSKGEQPEFVK